MQTYSSSGYIFRGQTVQWCRRTGYNETDIIKSYLHLYFLCKALRTTFVFSINWLGLTDTTSHCHHIHMLNCLIRMSFLRPCCWIKILFCIKAQHEMWCMNLSLTREWRASENNVKRETEWGVEEWSDKRSNRDLEMEGRKSQEKGDRRRWESCVLSP